MRGTGSHSIEVPGTVVPDHFVVADDPFDAREDDRTVAEVAYGNPLYHPQHINFFHGEIGAIMSSIAAAAVDEYERIAAKRTYDPLPPGPRWAAPDYTPARHRRGEGAGGARDRPRHGAAPPRDRAARRRGRRAL